MANLTLSQNDFLPYVFKYIIFNYIQQWILYELLSVSLNKQLNE
jgi:hypothetical protein